MAVGLLGLTLVGWEKTFAGVLIEWQQHVARQPLLRGFGFQIPSIHARVQFNYVIGASPLEAHRHTVDLQPAALVCERSSGCVGSLTEGNLAWGKSG
ncbi:hypothetical protein OKW42_004654 [Paraburkholderia sp. WC7.3d]